MNKKIISIIALIIALFFIYKFFSPGLMKFSYVPHNHPMKCSGKNYLVGENKYIGQVENYMLKSWELQLYNVDSKNSFQAHLYTANQDPIAKGTSIMLATNCTVLNNAEIFIEHYKKALIEKPEDETLRNEYDVYFYDEKNRQIELKSAKIIDTTIYLNIKDYIANERSNKNP